MSDRVNISLSCRLYKVFGIASVNKFMADLEDFSNKLLSDLLFDVKFKYIITYDDLGNKEYSKINKYMDNTIYFNIVICNKKLSFDDLKIRIFKEILLFLSRSAPLKSSKLSLLNLLNNIGYRIGYKYDISRYPEFTQKDIDDANSINFVDNETNNFSSRSDNVDDIINNISLNRTASSEFDIDNLKEVLSNA